MSAINFEATYARLTGDTADFFYSVQTARLIEAQAQSGLAAHTLMRRAGGAVARLALALAPAARCIWLACGPGHNGSDGLMAAAWLARHGVGVWVTWLGDAARASADTQDALRALQAAGVPLRTERPTAWDLGIDALLGLGAQARTPQGELAACIAALNQGPVLAVDLPSGLGADHGTCSTPHVRAQHTLCLLSLKPGLFTAQGRDASGRIWFDDLGVDPGAWPSPPAACARLGRPPAPWLRAHASHKGLWGDLAVLGGAAGLQGAAWLAARAALHAGAGRVFVSLLADGPDAAGAAGAELALMRRAPGLWPASLKALVCGCGGGTAIADWLSTALDQPAALVLDADALGALAQRSPSLDALAQRARAGGVSVLTPHPLEAARLLGCSAAQVQADRLGAAQRLAERSQAVVVLKGSGTLIAQAGQCTVLNPSGNARLASAGSGDVLAGLIGARLAQGQSAFQAACDAVYAHGAAAAQGSTPVLVADDLVRAAAAALGAQPRPTNGIPVAITV